jgi:hypothetical protein
MYALFAQAGKGGNAGPDGGLLAGMVCFYVVAIAIGIGIQILFLLTMSKCLKQISSRNRKMEPGQVWLCLIPIFGYVWSFIMVLRVAESLQYEFEDRGLRGDGDYGKTIGLVYLIGSLVCGPVGLVCWIMYWLKISGYTKQLQESGREPYEGEDEDDRPRRKSRRDEDDEDDRPRRRRRDDDYDDDDRR